MMTVDRFEVDHRADAAPPGRDPRRLDEAASGRTSASSVDDSGTVDWLIRTEASKALDPDKVVLEDVEINDGAVTYADARTGVAFSAQHVNALVEARSLSGPWRVEGSYLDGEHAACRSGCDRPASWKTARSASRPTSARHAGRWRSPPTASSPAAPTGFSYTGTYNRHRGLVTPRDGGGEGSGEAPRARRRLTPSRRLAKRGQLSADPRPARHRQGGPLPGAAGPAGQPRRVAHRRSSATTPRFSADDRGAPARPRPLARQGTEPSRSRSAKAAESLVRLARRRCTCRRCRAGSRFNVPAIVVGGAVIQDVGFEAAPAGERLADRRLPRPSSRAGDARCRRHALDRRASSASAATSGSRSASRRPSRPGGAAAARAAPAGCSRPSIFPAGHRSSPATDRASTR